MSDLWCAAVDVQDRAGDGKVSDERAALVARMATDLLGWLSGNQFGLTTRTVRPHGCGESCDWGPPSSRVTVGWGMALPLATVLGPWPLPGPAGGMTAACGGCGGVSTSGIRLDGPVVWDADHPVTVTVDGEPLLPGSGWVLITDRDRGPLLARVDGKVFPQCQNLLLEPDQPGTCQVIYSRGVAVPEMGRQAAISLAVELARLNKWLAGDTCLPRRVTTITRQGVTAVTIDPLDVIKNGGTGLTDVDLFIAAVNPNGLRRRASIHTPGMSDPLPTVRSAP